MSRTISLIQRVQIASPCTADWNSMTGDDRVRFCGQCKLNVYNLSEMTEREAEKLILDKEGKLCARIYRRKDGTVITRDCPLGWKAIRRKTLRLCVRTAAALLAIAAATAYAIGPKREDNKDAATDFIGFVELDEGVFRKASSNMDRWLTDRFDSIAFAGEISVPPPPKQK